MVADAALYDFAVSDRRVQERVHVRENARGQRAALLRMLRVAAKRLGEQLASDSDDAAFSKHGSLFQQLSGPRLNDVDVYVVLDGARLRWHGHELNGPPCNAVTRTQVGNPKDAIDLMMRIIRAVEPPLDAARSDRGATLSHGGISFDVIPAFSFSKQGKTCHLIPAVDGWEENPTLHDSEERNRLATEYPSRPELKLLGYCDLVKLFKFIKRSCGWTESHGITSFMIRWAVSKAVQKRCFPEQGNRARFNLVLTQLNACIQRGAFKDPYTGKERALQSRCTFKSSVVLARLPSG